MNAIGAVMNAMIAYYEGDPKRVNHFLKVYGFAKAVGEAEGLDAKTLGILELAALTHDIGIKNSERKYGSAAGKYQEMEGPPEAEKLLSALNIPPAVTERVCFLIAHHHTYRGVEGLDWQILLEADFLVNAYEDGLSKEAIKTFEDRVFRTKTSKELLWLLFL